MEGLPGRSALLRRFFSVRWVLNTALVLVVPEPALALDANKPLHRLLRNAWQVDDGLPQNSVNAMTQTPDGYLWLGTQEGLVRFDGNEFVVFDRYNTSEITDPEIVALTVGADGGLWAGTKRELVRYHQGPRFDRFDRQSGLPVSEITALVVDEQAHVWVGTTGGLVELDRDAKVVRTYQVRDGLLNKEVTAIASDGQGGVLVASGRDSASRGIQHLTRDRRFKKVLAGPDGVGRYVTVLSLDQDGSVWIGTREGPPLQRWSPDGKIERYGWQRGLIAQHVTAVLRDRDGFLWVATYDGGVFREEEGQFVGVGDPAMFNESRVSVLFEDREGSVWFGTETGGMVQLWDGDFTSLTARDGLTGGIAISAYADEEDNVWIGTEDGVSRVEGREIVATLTEEDGLLPGPHFAFLRVDDELWIGGDTGISIYDMNNGSFRYFTTDNGLPAPTVKALLHASDDSIWIGTRGKGIVRLKDGVPKTYDHLDGLVHDQVRAIYETREGVIWIGTERGASRLFEEDFTNFNEDDGLTDSSVHFFYQDLEGMLWIGTDDGLFRYQGKRFDRLNVGKGLHDDIVYTVLEDRSGQFWMSSNKGVSRTSKAQITDVFAGKLTKVESVSYGVEDGMASSECNSGGEDAGTISKDGRIWVPTLRGVVIIEPQKRTRVLKPPVLLEKVVADGNSYVPKNKLILGPGIQELQFHFGAPSFVVPKKIRFEYRLRNFKDEWVDFGHQRIATFLNLDHGDYTFEVRSRNKYGVYSPYISSVQLSIRPKLTERPLFYFGVGVLVVLLGLALHRVRIRTMEEREAAQERLLKERTRELEDANRRLIQQTFNDALTSIRNRHYVYDAIPNYLATIDRELFEAKARGDSDEVKDDIGMVFIMLDLDKFKSINDTYGHAAGDAVLKEVARILQKVGRLTDTIARWGGEEFMLIARNTGRAKAHILAERIRRAFREHTFEIGGGRTIDVTCSIGFSAYPFSLDKPGLVSWEEVLNVADKALYSAKFSGRDMFVGVFGNDETPEHEGLSKLLREDFYGMIEREELKVVSSMVDLKRLKWK